MGLRLALLCIGVVVLYYGAEWLVRGAARLAGSMGVSPIVIGLTVVSLGTSAPEMVVCVVAALEGSGNLAMGNVIGSNLANVGLILGIAAVISPLKLAGRVVAREVPIMLVITLLLYPLLLDLTLSRLDGSLLLVMLVLYLGFIGWTAGGEESSVVGEFEEFVETESEGDGSGGDSPARPFRDLGLLVVGASGVVLGGQLIVDNAVIIARSVGISELVIGLTMVAIGTSLPELATSLVATVRKESDIAVGNIVGSNIFNITAVLGLTTVIRPVSLDASIIRVEFPAVVAVSVLILIIALTSREIRRWEGGILLAAYAGAGVWVLL